MKTVSKRHVRRDQQSSACTTKKYLQAMKSQLSTIRKFPDSRLCSEAVVGLCWVGASTILHDDGRRVGSSLAASLHILTFGERSQEAADKGIPGAIRVNELLLRQSQDGVFLHGAIDGDNGGVCALSDDHCA